MRIFEFRFSMVVFAVFNFAVATSSCERRRFTCSCDTIKATAVFAATAPTVDEVSMRERFFGELVAVALAVAVAVATGVAVAVVLALAAVNEDLLNMGKIAAGGSKVHWGQFFAWSRTFFSGV